MIDHHQMAVLVVCSRAVAGGSEVRILGLTADHMGTGARVGR